MSSQRTFLRRLTGAVALLGLVAGLATPAEAAAEAPAEAVAKSRARASEPAADRSAPLRIMPLGDSITWGVGSNHRDGYRSALRRRLASAGVDVDFVGSVTSGRGPDREHEGHKGWTIAQLAEHLDDWLATYEPDVILLHIGTNDMVRGVADAPRQLSSLLDRIAADRPEAEVFVAKIIGLADYRDAGDQTRRTDAFNDVVEGIVASRGDRFHLVDQSGIHGIDMRNREHPNDYGYAQIAWNWYRAMEPVLNGDGRGWPATADPYRAAVSWRCIDHSTLDPAVLGCHAWYHRRPAGSTGRRVWQLPVRERVQVRVKVDGKVVVRTRVVLRWVTAG